MNTVLKTTATTDLVLSLTLAARAQSLKLGDNLSDRGSGWGAVVEQINAVFKKFEASVSRP